MISRKTLLKLIKEAIAAEEFLINIYAGHCMLAVDTLPVDQEKIEHCRNFFAKLRDDCRRHRQILEKLCKNIEMDHDRKDY